MAILYTVKSIRPRRKYCTFYTGHLKLDNLNTLLYSAYYKLYNIVQL